VWKRRDNGGGLVPGSVGAFLVLEASRHARDRGAMPYARVSRVVSDRSRRGAGDAAASAARLFGSLKLGSRTGKVGVLSGASGVDPATAEELQFLAGLERRGFGPVVRAWGNVLGHSLEAHFIAGLALAAIAISKEAFYPPFDESEIEKPDRINAQRMLVTLFGHWRGEGLGLVESVW
jgi:3-oxoacyl-[acyl-carrier-protein] synthase II